MTPLPIIVFYLIVVSLSFPIYANNAQALSLSNLDIGSPSNLIQTDSQNDNSSAVAPFANKPVIQNSTQTIGSQSVTINEVELNSPNGTQWLELYNPTLAPVTLSNYTITSVKNSTITIPSGTIAPRGFVLEIAPKGSFSNIADILTLRNSAGTPLARTPLLIDRLDDLRTWQQVPDGSNEWRFQNQTALRPNDPATYANATFNHSLAPAYNSIENTTAACTGSAGCAEGTIIRISSINTLYLQVNSTIYKVQLALVNASPAIVQGLASTLSVVESYCLGNNALVDQDDGNPVSGGSVVAAVYCSNANINELLLQTGLANTDHSQCKVSEFATRSWAKALGC